MAENSSSNVASVAIVVIVLLVAAAFYLVIVNSEQDDVDIDLPDVEIEAPAEPQGLVQPAPPDRAVGFEAFATPSRS